MRARATFLGGFWRARNRSRRSDPREVHASHKSADTGRSEDPPSRRPPARYAESHGPTLCGPIRFPLNGFTYSWTLSSKFFSTFPHGTCPLSVSCQYLALDGVYHPLRAAFSNNPTPGRRRVTGSRCRRGLTPAMDEAPIRRTWTSAACHRGSPQHYSSRCRDDRGFSAGLFPLHSPLLRESLLVSFPPLINMLKFSGWSCLIWGQIQRFSNDSKGNNRTIRWRWTRDRKGQKLVKPFGRAPLLEKRTTRIGSSS